MDGTAPDDELMGSVARGDRAAFAPLVDRHKHAIVGYLARLLGCRDRADDLAQETFVRLYESAGRYRAEGHLKPLLYRIATNLARSEERRARRHRMVMGMLGRNGHGPDLPDASAIGGERQRLLARAIADLPVRLRAPLLLHEIEGMSYEEVARALACREGTVKSRINRGREAIRERLAPILGGNGR